MKIIIPILFSVLLFSCKHEVKEEEYERYSRQYIHNRKYYVQPTQCGYFIVNTEDDGILKRYYSGYYEKPFEAQERGYHAAIDTFYFKYDSLQIDKIIDSCFKQPVLNKDIHEALQRYNYEFVKFGYCDRFSNDFYLKHTITKAYAKSRIDTWASYYNDSTFYLIRYLELRFPNEEVIFKFKLRDALSDAASQ